MFDFIFSLSFSSVFRMRKVGEKAGGRAPVWGHPFVSDGWAVGGHPPKDAAPPSTNSTTTRSEIKRKRERSESHRTRRQQALHHRRGSLRARSSDLVVSNPGPSTCPSRRPAPQRCSGRRGSPAYIHETTRPARIAGTGIQALGWSTGASPRCATCPISHSPTVLA